MKSCNATTVHSVSCMIIKLFSSFSRQDWRAHGKPIICGANWEEFWASIELIDILEKPQLLKASRIVFTTLGVLVELSKYSGLLAGS